MRWPQWYPVAYFFNSSFHLKSGLEGQLRVIVGVRGQIRGRPMLCRWPSIITRALLISNVHFLRVA